MTLVHASVEPVKHWPCATLGLRTGCAQQAEVALPSSTCGGGWTATGEEVRVGCQDYLPAFRPCLSSGLNPLDSGSPTLRNTLENFMIPFIWESQRPLQICWEGARVMLAMGSVINLFIFKIFIYLFRLHRVLVKARRLLSCGMWTLSCGMRAGSSSSTRDGTRAPCSGSTESHPLDHQGSPSTPEVTGKWENTWDPLLLWPLERRCVLLASGAV